jgi:hypothetical protein
MDGTDKPDYDACVAIVTREALKEMVWPALLALLLPVFVGFGFKAFGAWTGRPQLGVEVVAAFMMFGTLAGLLMATFTDNAGGAWDNAKKLIESQGQKGSEAHKAAVTGDTVGVSQTRTDGWRLTSRHQSAAARAHCTQRLVLLVFRCCAVLGSVQGHGWSGAARHHHHGPSHRGALAALHATTTRCALRSSSRTADSRIPALRFCACFVLQMSTTILVLGPLFASTTAK